MKLKNKIKFVSVMASVMVSFLYPFSGNTVYAEPDSDDNSISESAPKEGQENRYEYAGEEVLWTVPVTGYYTITCAGGKGANGWVSEGGHNGESGYRITEGAGTPGYVYSGQFRLESGSALTIHAGGAATGTWGRGCGWSDGGAGDGSSGSGVYAGDGGGSSYVLCGETKVLSAKGGSGGKASWKNTSGYGKSASGGSGGGLNTYCDVEGTVQTVTSTVSTASAANSGNGYIAIRLDEICLSVSLDAATEWTSEPVTISAKVISEGEGLPEECLSWETDEEGNAVWTNTDTYTVSQNGAYTCKVRDVAGNIGETVIEITNIDKLQPEAELIADKTDWTRERIVLTIVADDAEATECYGKSGLGEKSYLWGYRTENEEIVWGEWTENKKYEAEDNGVYLCKVVDNAENETEVECKVTNIDKTPPKVSFEKTQKWYKGSTEVLIKAEDLQPDGTAGCGLPEEAYSFDGVTFGKENKLTVEKEGMHTVWVTDRLGNVQCEELEVRYDEEEEEDEEDEEDDEEAEFLPEIVVEELPEEYVEEWIESQEEVVEETDDVAENPVSEVKRSKEAEKEITTADNEESGIALPVIQEKETAVKKLPQTQTKEKEENVIRILRNEKQKKEIKENAEWKEVILYSTWMVVILCGLLWMLFSLIFEHAVVYRRDDKGKYYKIGRCAILRKKEYKQVNLIRFMKRGEEQKYMICFARAFVILHKKEKILIRKWDGVELRNVERKIEI